MTNKNYYSKWNLLVLDELSKVAKVETVPERTHCKECNHELKSGKCVNYLCKLVKSR